MVMLADSSLLCLYQQYTRVILQRDVIITCLK